MSPELILSIINEGLKAYNANQATKTAEQVKAETLFWLELFKPLIYWGLNDEQKKAFDAIEKALQPKVPA